MNSLVTKRNTIQLPLITDEISMVPFDLATFEGLYEVFKNIVVQMMQGIKHAGGTAFFTIHGKILKKGGTLRRGGPHTDGNYDPVLMGFGTGGGSGWKVGEDGPDINTDLHKRQYNKETGGIVMVSNYESCLGYIGEFDGLPHTGGNCSHIELNNPFVLEKDRVYYGNNHFIHESLPVDCDVHRVLARVTMPENHQYSNMN